MDDCEDRDYYGRYENGYAYQLNYALSGHIVSSLLVILLAGLLA